MFGLLICWSAADWVRRRLRRYEFVDGATFLTGIRKWALLSSFRKQGLVVDGKRRISARRSYRHLAVIAPTGTGKTSSIIVPNLLALNGKTSTVVPDPSGEVFEATSGYLHQLGYRIAVLDVSNVERSLSFNPLHRARSHTEIQKVSEVLISAAFPGDDGSNKFWNDGAKSVLSILIRCLNDVDPKFRNLANVRRLLNHFGVDGSGLDEFVARNADRPTFDDYKGLRSNSERVLSNIVSTARTAIDPFGDPDLCQISSVETLHFETLRQRATVVYLIIPEHEVTYYSFWLSLLYTQIFNFAMVRPQHGQPYLPITFLLDEFGNGSKIPGFSMFCTTLRKRNCCLVLALQDTEQLVHIYGRSDASTILNGGVSSKVYLPGLSLKTCQELEQTLGKQTVEDRETGQRFSRSLMTADESRTMPDDAAVLISGNSPPVRLKMKPYFRRRRFRKRAGIPPPELALAASPPVEYIEIEPNSGKRETEESSHPEPQLTENGVDV